MTQRKPLIFVTFCFICQLVVAQSKSIPSFDGVKIAFRDQGAGEPVLLIHGFINSAASWNGTPLQQELLDRGYRVIVPDLRGNGNSGKPKGDKAYENDAEVRDLIALMDNLHIKSYKAIGYSRGSIVLAKLLTMDKRIEKAVLGGMGIDFTNPQWERRIMFAKAFDGQVNGMTQGAVEYAKSINADLRSLYLQQKHQPVTSKKQLAKIDIPILIIHGNTDTDNGNTRDLSELFEYGALKIVPGDHNGTYRSLEFSDKILQFIQR